MDILEKEGIIVNGKLTGTLGKKGEPIKQKDNEEFGKEFDPIQQVWRVNPADEEDYKGEVGFKDA